jgi:hypothetical protein
MKIGVLLGKYDQTVFEEVIALYVQLLHFIS